MKKSFAADFSNTFNAEVRRQYSDKVKQVGNRSLLDIVVPHLALRQYTPYPYKFVEDDSLLPSDGRAFGRIIRRSRQEGIAEIHQSVSTQREEHKWLFLPRDEVWVDTTLRASVDEVEGDKPTYVFLSHLYPEIEDFHTHLDLAATELAREHGEQYKDAYLKRGAMPSGNDLMGHCDMTAAIAPESQPVGSIISHYGVTSLTLTGALSEGFKIVKYNDMAALPNQEETIQALLTEVTANVLRSDGTPAIALQFDPLI
ncbi:MAG TPA: hypothetical protein VLG16_00940 [Candidatus Saccharimonadales bacterium]|nr:hypothetical protein [Candidatus Saccharimonadales bacterium]